MTDDIGKDEPPAARSGAPRIVAPQAAFRGCSEAEITAALDDPDPTNAIACEVARLVEGYMGNFAAQVERLGHIPESIVRFAPSSPIEAVAMRLVTETMRAALSTKRR